MYRDESSGGGGEPWGDHGPTIKIAHTCFVGVALDLPGVSQKGVLGSDAQVAIGICAHGHFTAVIDGCLILPLPRKVPFRARCRMAWRIMTKAYKGAEDG